MTRLSTMTATFAACLAFYGCDDGETSTPTEGADETGEVQRAGDEPVAEVEGALDKDIIRRIVRAHIPEIRHCYNEELIENPNTAGHITTRFTIDADGDIIEITSEDSNLPATLDACIVSAVERWKFPKPRGGGNVVVSYPFFLEPG